MGKLFIHYSSAMNKRDTEGFYRFEDWTSKLPHYATNFEPFYARSAFPCWDEPSFKSTFSISIIAPKKLTVLSNSPMIKCQGLEETEYLHNSLFSEVLKGLKGNIDDLSVHVFDQTLLMSTYLVAWFIGGGMTFVENSVNVSLNSTEEKILPIRVYAPSKEIEKTKFGLEVVTDAIEFFVNYFQESFPLPKLDILVLSKGETMENWGLIFFNENSFLIDDHPDCNDKKVKKIPRVITAIAHELAHFWIGNNVTMHWWNDLWLKEAVVTWLSWNFFEKYRPEWGGWALFIATDFQLGLMADTRTGIEMHPLSPDFTEHSKVQSLFDLITYHKGCSIIRMLVDLMGGEEKFQFFLQALLTKFKFSTIKSKDFFDILSKQNALAANLIKYWAESGIL